MGLRNAPRREVLRIIREGAYPHIRWLHVLECGHTAVRKRKAPASRIGCLVCLGQKGV